MQNASNLKLIPPMKKIKGIILLLMALLLVSFLGFVNLSAAENKADVYLMSPVNGLTYNESKVMVSLSVRAESAQLNCYLDGKVYNGFGWETNEQVSFFLLNLSQGQHKIEIRGNAVIVVDPLFEVFYGVHSPRATVEINPEIVHFFVNLAPVISISSSDFYNNTKQAMVNITTNRPDAVVSYCLDGKDNITLSSNKIIQYEGTYQYSLLLLGLADGAHNLTAFSTNAFGTGVFEKNFTLQTIKQPETSPSVSQTVIVITTAVIASVILAGALLLVIYRKQNLKRKDNLAGSNGV